MLKGLQNYLTNQLSKGIIFEESFVGFHEANCHIVMYLFAAKE